MDDPFSRSRAELVRAGWDLMEQLRVANQRADDANAEKWGDAETGWSKVDVKFTFATDEEMEKAKARIARKKAKEAKPC